MRKFNITVNGKNYAVDVEEVGADSAMHPVAPIVSAAPTAAASTAAAPAAAGAGKPMNSPMPGLIKALKVANGATVKQGDVVLVLEAMKMENDILSNNDGVINFAVAEGANVDSGAVLFTIA